MRKGQAALEFLMTYGWAILVVLAAIAALAYFGVLNPDRFLPEKCTLPSGLACLDFKGDTTSVTLIVQNSLGFDINTLAVGLNGTGCVVSNQSSGPTHLINGEKGTFVFSTSCTPASGKWRGVVTINYVNQDTSLSHTKTGEVILGIA